MKEKDFDKYLDNLIIDGLIKEAEQDNADFEAAMRKISDEEFDEMIFEPAYAIEESHAASAIPSIRENRFPKIELKRAQRITIEEPTPTSLPKTAKHNILKREVFRPWLTSAVAAAVVVLIVLIPSINYMDGKLCDSVLYASESYLTPSKGRMDVANASVEELKKELPNLESRYKNCIQVDGKLTHYTDDLQEAGWDLTIAYLKLHKKKDAVKVLKVLSTQFNGTPFGNHCQTMLEHL